MKQETTFLTERGTLTLPAAIRKSLGLKGKQQLIVEMTSAGEIVLRPAAVVPIEIYTEERIAEFARDDKILQRKRVVRQDLNFFRAFRGGMIWWT